MKKIVLGLFVVSAMIGTLASAETLESKVDKKVDKLSQTVLDGCKKELASYCKDVTPGEGRLLACLYAFENKLSGRCDYALYDAADQLEQAVDKVSFVAGECANDLQKHCSDVPPGEMRLANCLKKNKKKLDERCSKAIKDTFPK